MGIFRFKNSGWKKYKESIIGKINQSAKDVWSLNEKAEYLSSIADEVIFLGGKIGIGPMFLKNEYEILVSASKQYNKCIDKIIWIILIFLTFTFKTY